MATHLPGFLSVRLRDGVFVTFEQVGQRFGIQPLWCYRIESDLRDRILLDKATGADNLMNPTVWPWRGHIVLNHDRFAFGSADNRCIDIPEFVLPFGKITLWSVVQDGGIGQAKLIGRDRNQILHPIAPVNIQDLAIIGRLLNEGRVDRTKVIAVAGSEVKNPQYYRLIDGAPVASVLKDNLKPTAHNPRIISGNVLTGRKTPADGFIGFYANMVTVIPEGNHYELLGWAMPRLNKFSVSRAYFSWLCPKKVYDLDTNLNGGERPFVVTGLYDKYLPMDIYPTYLLKAILAGDIDKMENLGIYEVVEEDFALCEFVDPSKIEMQQIIRDGINLMIKEA